MTPLKNEPGRWRLKLSALDILCIAAVAMIVAIWLSASNFTPDSWSYFELSNTFFSDFYRINTYRQYQAVSSYATSFPPLYPCLLAVGRSVWDFGIYTGVFLNAGICIATLFLVKYLVTRIGQPAWVGNVLFLAMLMRPDYIEEMMAARSIPLALFLLVALLCVYVRPSTLTMPRAALIGLLAGLSVLARFDFLACAAMLGLVLAWYAWNQTRLVMPAYFLALAVTISPWVIYSLTHFSKPFVSDNSRTAMLISKSYVTDYFPDQQQLQFAWDSPARWAMSVVVKRLPQPILSCIRSVLSDLSLLLLAGVFVGIWLIGRSGPRSSLPDDGQGPAGGTLDQWFGIALLLAMQVFTIGLTGYGNSRYYLPLQFFLALVLVHAIGMRIDLHAVFQQCSLRTLRVVSLVCIASITFLAVAEALPELEHRLTAKDAPLFALNQQHLNADTFDEILSEIRQSDEPPRVLIVSGVDAFQFGALTGCVTFSKPRNLDAETCVPFVNTYEVTHVLDTDGELISTLQGSLSMESTGIPGLMKIPSRKPRVSLIRHSDTGALQLSGPKGEGA